MIEGMILREARKKMHLSANDLAKRIGISVPLVYFYEKSRKIPRTKFLGRVVKELNLDSDYFFSSEIFEDGTSYDAAVVGKLFCSADEYDQKLIRKVLNRYDRGLDCEEI
jgi:transcriptional regulator with XRE-family HTH domain